MFNTWRPNTAAGDKSSLVLVVCTAFALQACTSTYPSLDGPFGLWAGTEDLSRSEIASQLVCELRDFLRHDAHSLSGKVKLNELKPATVTLNVQTDVAGGITYFGIDLSILSLDSFIALSNGRSSLFARIQGKSTVLSQLEFTIPQTLRGPTEANTRKGKVSKESPLSKLKFAGFADRELKVCETPLPYSSRLGIRNALRKFFADSSRENDGALSMACQTRLTFRTGLQFLVSGGGSIVPFGTSPARFLIPVNLLVADLSPTFTHNVSIAFSLSDENNPGICPGGSGQAAGS